MASIKTAAAITAILLICPVTAAYDSSTAGSNTPTTECNDGADNDGDGKTDADDPGCVEPLYKDRSEANVFDRDATTAFSSRISSPIPSSAFYGGNAFASATKIPDEKTNNGNAVVEQYVEGAKDSSTQNQLKEKTYSAADADVQATATLQQDGASLLVNSPSKATESHTCGNGIPENNEGGKQGCPEDHGMLDMTLDDSIDSKGDQNEVYFDIGDSSNRPGGSETQRLPMECIEADPKNSYDVTDGAGGQVTIGLGNKNRNPDYAKATGSIGSGSSDKALEIDCAENNGARTSITSGPLPVTDHDKNTHSPEDVGGSEQMYPDNGRLDTSGQQMCGNNGDERTGEGDLKTKSKEVEYYSPVLTLRKDGPNNHGAAKDTESSLTSFTVKWNVPSGNNKKTYRVCNDEGTYYDDCEKQETYTNQTTGKEETRIVKCSKHPDGPDEETVYSIGQEEGVVKGFDETTVNFQHKNYKITHETVYNTNTNDIVDTVKQDSPYAMSNFNYDSSNRALYTDDSSKENSLAQGNDPAVSRNKFKVSVNENNNFVAERDSSKTADADGPNGRGDGYILLDSRFPSDIGYPQIRGQSPKAFKTERVRRGQTNYVTRNTVERNADECTDGVWCLRSIDLSTKSQGWNTVAQSDRVTRQPSTPVSLSSTSGACEMATHIADDDWKESIDCEYDISSSSSGGTTSEPQKQVCGDDKNEYTAYMEGPEINEDVVVQKDASQEGCVDKKTDCVLNGEDVSEGTVADISSVDPSYEKGGPSPDREICLAYERSQNPENPVYQDGDYYQDPDSKQAGDKEEMGGEWYDLDSELVEKYLRNNGRDLINDDVSDVKDSNNDGESNSEDVDYYIRQNKGTYHPEYNPGAKNQDGLPAGMGTAVEDDCGPGLQGCDDNKQKTSGKQPLFYSFLSEGKRDEDYNPEGGSTEGSENYKNAKYTGYVVKSWDFSNQLDSNMDTNREESISSVSIWNRSEAEEGTVDRYALAQNQTVAVSTRGRVFEQGSVYYNKDWDAGSRDSLESSSITKKSRVFGNSYAAVSTQSTGSQVPANRGIWIDPDFLRAGFNDEFKIGSAQDWRNELSFKMDITGPDSGLGFDMPGKSSTTASDSGRVIKADIYWEGEDGQSFAYKSNGQEDRTTINGPEQDNTNQQLEPPMCGDDSNEYLFEQSGESPNSGLYNGVYACVSDRSYCVYTENGQTQIVDASTDPYRNTHEPDEDEGRFKQDEEVCIRRTGATVDPQAYWWDQDYGDTDGDGLQDTCRVNNLFGAEGVRWFPSDYVNEYPFAVTGGIDDDINQLIKDSTTSSQRFESTPEQFKSSSEPQDWESTKTPVPTGTTETQVATKGFCGGDDGSEYLATQVCRTDVCKTRKSHFGVAATQGACVYDGRKAAHEDVPQPQSAENQKRKIHQPGDSITLDYNQAVEITCVEGAWYRSGPIVFNKNTVDVPFGSSNTVGFQVINLGTETRTYNVELLDTKTARFASFSGEEQPGSFEVSLEPKESEAYQVKIRGTKEDLNGDENSPDKVRVRATAQSFETTGTDDVTAQITVPDEEGQQPGGQQDTESVPGIGTVQIAVLLLVAAATLTAKRTRLFSRN